MLNTAYRTKALLSLNTSYRLLNLLHTTIHNSTLLNIHKVSLQFIYSYICNFFTFGNLTSMIFAVILKLYEENFVYNKSCRLL